MFYVIVTSVVAREVGEVKQFCKAIAVMLLKRILIMQFISFMCPVKIKDGLMLTFG